MDRDVAPRIDFSDLERGGSADESTDEDLALSMSLDNMMRSEIKPTDYSFQGLVGRGTFGRIYLVQHRCAVCVAVCVAVCAPARLCVFIVSGWWTRMDWLASLDI